jgi:hypothetical protein
MPRWISGTQLLDLGAQPAQLGLLGTVHPRALTGFDLGLTHPIQQRLWGTNAQLGSHRLACRPIGGVLRADLTNHADRPFTQLGRIVV